MKKAQKNKARLPRTAALRTLSELSEGLTKAGMDPSRIQERAAILAKVQRAKRKRREEEEGMDVDMEGDEGDEGDWMDVDDAEGGKTVKRIKTNEGGAVTAKGSRVPRSNRMLAGMRDQTVSSGFLSTMSILMFTSLYGKHPRPSSYAILDSASGICSRKPARVIGLSKSKWCVFIGITGYLFSMLTAYFLA